MIHDQQFMQLASLAKKPNTLVEEYKLICGILIMEAADDMLTIMPLFFFSIPGKTRCVI